MGSFDLVAKKENERTRLLFNEYLPKNGAETTKEELDSDHHDDQSHKAHQHFVARLSEPAGDGRGKEQGCCIQSDNGRHDRDQNGFVSKAAGVFHQDDRIGDRAWASDHWNCQRRDGDIAHVFLRLFFWHPYGTQTRLQHIIAQHKEQDAAHHSEPVNGNAKETEQELTGQGKEQEDQKGREPASSGRLSPCMVIETRGHGNEYRHQSKWIDQGQKGGEGQQAKFNRIQ